MFTTIHKFFPEEKGYQFPLLSDRRNIVVIADEAHGSQYDFVDGYARHMRDALPSVRANLRRLVRRIRRKYGFPPDVQEVATNTVLEQAEVLSENWPLTA